MLSPWLHLSTSCKAPDCFRSLGEPTAQSTLKKKKKSATLRVSVHLNRRQPASRRGYSNLRPGGGGATVMSFPYNNVGVYNYRSIALKTQVIQPHRLSVSVDGQMYELNLNAELIGSEMTDFCDPLSAVSLRHATAAAGRPSWRSWSALHLLLLHQPPVVGQDFTLGQIERHLQGHQDGKLKWDQLSPADPETLL